MIRTLDELIATDGVRELMELRGPVGMMALHGGLEEETFELAAECATRAGASLYAVVLPGDLKWHVPSVRFDPRLSSRLRRFLTQVRVAFSVHGFGRPGYEHSVLLGGRNRPLARRLAADLESRTKLGIIADLDAMPPDLRGLSADNPVNLPELGGVQVELSAGARTARCLPVLADSLVAVGGTEQRSLCVAG